MTVITEAELREMWQGGRGTIAPLPRNARFTPSAKDFISQWGITITFEDESAPPPNADTQPVAPAWDKPGAFPVQLKGDVPVCSVCGQPVTHKPEHLSQVDAGHFAPKTSPRFIFRGKMDTLHAQTLLATAQARRFNFPQLAAQLDSLAAYCREITSAEYHGRTVSPLALGGKTEADIHDITHHPQKYLGIAHVVPTANNHEMLLVLNLLRAQSRETELTAVHTFTDADGHPTRPDLLQALNRFSSAVYYLELLFAAGKFPWQAPGGMMKNE